MSVVVHIEEEYGYRNWLWVTDMSEEELVYWWNKQKTVNAFFYEGPVSFPGDVHQVYHVPKWKRELMPDEEHYTDNDFEFYLVEEGDGRTLVPISPKLKLPEDHWYMHLHTDEDSYMKTSDDEFVYHEGKVSEDEYYSDKYEPSEEAVMAGQVALMEHMKKVMKEWQEEERDGDNSNSRDIDEYN